MCYRQPLPAGWTFKSNDTQCKNDFTADFFFLRFFKFSVSLRLRQTNMLSPSHFDSADQPGQARVRQADAGGAAHQTSAETSQCGPSS